MLLEDFRSRPVDRRGVRRKGFAVNRESHQAFLILRFGLTVAPITAPRAGDAAPGLTARVGPGIREAFAFLGERCDRMVTAVLGRLTQRLPT